MNHLLRKLWRHDEGQDIAEYAVMLAVILVLVVGTIRLIGSNANNVFSQQPVQFNDPARISSRHVLISFAGPAKTSSHCGRPLYSFRLYTLKHDADQ